MLESLLKKRAAIEDKVAVCEPDGTCYSYSQLESWSNRMASYLQGKGLGSGDRVVCLLPPSAFQISMFFALQKIKAIMVPVNPSLNSSLIDSMIEEIAPAIVLDAYGHRGEGWQDLASFNGVEAEYAYNQDMENPAMILFTGGTTGDPKGAIIPQRAMVWNALNTIFSWNLSSKDVTLNSMPLYHTGGWNVLLMPLLMAGGKVILGGEKFSPGSVIETLENEGVTIYMAVPTMLRSISMSPLFPTSHLEGTRFVSGGGELPLSTFQAFTKRGIRITQGYGLTEAGPNNFNIPYETCIKKPFSVGKPDMFIEMKIAEDGELLIRGPHVFSGYWKRPEERPIDEYGYLKTGDIFAVDADGDYYFVDRKKNMIKTGGENVYSSEVEDALLRVPGVAESCVIGLPDEYWGEKVTAFVVRNDPSLTEEKIKTSLKDYIAGFKIPKAIIFLEKIPKSTVGKPLKNELRSKYEKSLH